MRAHHTTRSTGARVLTRIRPRVFAPYDASTLVPLLKPRVHPRETSARSARAGNYYDKLHAGDAFDVPCKFPPSFYIFVAQSPLSTLFINF